MHRTVALFVVLVSMAAFAYAQAPATSFAELHRRLAIGETIVVTSTGGQRIKGKVRSVSAAALVLRKGPDELLLAAGDVQRVARPGHALRDGAIVGLALGFSIGAVWASLQPCELVCFSSAFGVVLSGGVAGAIGAGVGAAVGASRPKEHVVFERAATGKAQAAITPHLTRGGAGILVRIAW